MLVGQLVHPSNGSGNPPTRGTGRYIYTSTHTGVCGKVTHEMSAKSTKSENQAPLTASKALEEINGILNTDVDNGSCVLLISQVVSRYRCGMP